MARDGYKMPGGKKTRADGVKGGKGSKASHPDLRKVQKGIRAPVEKQYRDEI